MPSVVTIEQTIKPLSRGQAAGSNNVFLQESETIGYCRCDGLLCNFFAINKQQKGIK
jgi:hypothetical protein